MKSLFIDSSNGVSGDMLLGSLIDIGVPLDVIKNPLDLLGLSKAYALIVEDSNSCGLRGIKLTVEDKGEKHEYSNWSRIRKLIEESSLKNSLKQKILHVFKALAKAEASVHGIGIEEVHFHEVGAIDSLVDIVGVCAAIDYLNPTDLIADFPPAGSGFVETAHGRLPVPVPAVLELAKTYKIKLIGGETSIGEITTPTGIALIAILADAFGRPPCFEVDSIGIGLGHRTLQRPNFLRTCLLREGNTSSGDRLNEVINCQEVVIQESWVDDSSPEDLSLLAEQLRGNGALDVSSQLIQMKKGRLGVSLQAIIQPSDREKFRSIWFTYGTTIGLRERIEKRWVLFRRRGSCMTSFGKVFVKQVKRPDGEFTVKVEHDELTRISYEKNVSVDDIRREVALAFHTFTPSEGWIN